MHQASFGNFQPKSGVFSCAGGNQEQTQTWCLKVAPVILEFFDFPCLHPVLFSCKIQSRHPFWHTVLLLALTYLLFVCFKLTQCQKQEGGGCGSRKALLKVKLYALSSVASMSLFAFVHRVLRVTSCCSSASEGHIRAETSSHCVNGYIEKEKWTQNASSVNTVQVKVSS